MLLSKTSLNMFQPNKSREFQLEDQVEKNVKNFAKFKKELGSIIEAVSVIQQEIVEAQRTCYIQIKSVSNIMARVFRNVVEKVEKSGEIS